MKDFFPKYPNPNPRLETLEQQSVPVLFEEVERMLESLDEEESLNGEGVDAIAYGYIKYEYRCWRSAFPPVSSTADLGLYTECKEDPTIQEEIRFSLAQFAIAIQVLKYCYSQDPRETAQIDPLDLKPGVNLQGAAVCLDLMQANLDLYNTLRDKETPGTAAYNMKILMHDLHNERKYTPESLSFSNWQAAYLDALKQKPESSPTASAAVNESPSAPNKVPRGGTETEEWSNTVSHSDQAH